MITRMNCWKVECKKDDIEYKSMSRTIKKQKQIICIYSCRIKNQIIKLRKYKKCRFIARRDLKALKLKKKQNDNTDLLSKIREIFTNDQIVVLKNNKRAWSNESIIKALRLRFACGITGYEELRCQKFPLPELRTLRRKVENF